MILHIMGIFVLIQIHAVTFPERIFYSISDKKQGETKMFLFMMPFLCIGSQKSFIVAEKYRNRGSMQTRTAVQLLIESMDFSQMDMCFFFQ